ncbi:hypothetical protein BS78_01G317600 [Paspalum vaginatum]|nr:hypothetical protein BS78_01G317600 [Paspalum vaginatum]
MVLYRLPPPLNRFPGPFLPNLGGCQVAHPRPRRDGAQLVPRRAGAGRHRHHAARAPPPTTPRPKRWRRGPRCARSRTRTPSSVPASEPPPPARCLRSRSRRRLRPRCSPSLLRSSRLAQRLTSTRSSSTSSTATRRRTRRPPTTAPPFYSPRSTSSRLPRATRRCSSESTRSRATSRRERAGEGARRTAGRRGGGAPAGGRGSGGGAGGEDPAAGHLEAVLGARARHGGLLHQRPVDVHAAIPRDRHGEVHADAAAPAQPRRDDQAARRVDACKENGGEALLRHDRRDDARGAAVQAAGERPGGDVEIGEKCNGELIRQ